MRKQRDYLRRAHTPALFGDRATPSEIILSDEIYNKEWIQNSLKTKYRKKIKLNNNVRGNRLKWQELANKNARSGLEYKLSVDSSIEIKL